MRRTPKRMQNFQGKMAQFVLTEPSVLSLKPLNATGLNTALIPVFQFSNSMTTAAAAENVVRLMTEAKINLIRLFSRAYSPTPPSK